jgi:ParB family chromosome partitioning protein
MTLIHIPLAAIQMDALPRDRSTLAPNALAELQSSIAAEGLRQPIEVWRLSTPSDGYDYGLISGFCRLTATKNLAALRPGAYPTIPAFLRTPTDITAALSAMITENEVRSPISPWDKGRILVETVREGHFPTLDAAVTALHPSATRQKRARLRACASVVEELDGLLTTPERLTENRLLRLASSLRGGFTDLIVQILKETHGQSLDSQWSALIQTLIEADRGEEEIPATATTPARPRRLLDLPQGLTIRRELSPGGYILRFSGPEAKRGGLMDDVMDMVERMLMPK